MGAHMTSITTLFIAILVLVVQVAHANPAKTTDIEITGASISSDGSRVVVATRVPGQAAQSQVMISDPGGFSRLDLPVRFDWWTPSFGEDGQSILLSSYCRAGCVKEELGWHIWEYDLVSQEVVRLTERSELIQWRPFEIGGEINFVQVAWASDILMSRLTSAGRILTVRSHQGSQLKFPKDASNFVGTSGKTWIRAQGVKFTDLQVIYSARDRLLITTRPRSLLPRLTNDPADEEPSNPRWSDDSRLIELARRLNQHPRPGLRAYAVDEISVREVQDSSAGPGRLRFRNIYAAAAFGGGRALVLASDMRPELDTALWLHRDGASKMLFRFPRDGHGVDALSASEDGQTIVVTRSPGFDNVGWGILVWRKGAGMQRTSVAQILGLED